MFFTNDIFYPIIDMDNFFFNSTVKDMQPYKVYQKNNDYIIEVKTLGISPDDIVITYNDRRIEVKGETHNPYSDDTYNTKMSFTLDDQTKNKLEKITYSNKNGITYITLHMIKEKINNVVVEKE